MRRRVSDLQEADRLRIEEFYNQPKEFARVISKIQSLLAHEKKKVNEFERNAITYIQNRLTELSFSIYFSSVMENVKVANKLDNLTINDIDKVVRVDDEIRAIFELKVRRKEQRKEILVPKSQWNTLRILNEKLDVPVFYLIKFPYGHYKLVKLNFWRTEIKNGLYRHFNGCYVKIPAEEGITLNETELLLALTDVLTEIEDAH